MQAYHWYLNLKEKIILIVNIQKVIYKRKLSKTCKIKKNIIGGFSYILIFFRSNGCVLKNKLKKKVFVLNLKHKSIKIEKNNKHLSKTVRIWSFIRKLNLAYTLETKKKYSIKLD